MCDRRDRPVTARRQPDSCFLPRPGVWGPARDFALYKSSTCSGGPQHFVMVRPPWPSSPSARGLRPPPPTPAESSFTRRAPLRSSERAAPRRERRPSRRTPWCPKIGCSSTCSSTSESSSCGVGEVAAVGRRPRSCEQERVRRRKNPIFGGSAILLSILFRDAWWRDEQSAKRTVQCAI